MQDDFSDAGVPGPLQFPSPNANQQDRRTLVSLAFDDRSPKRRLQASLYHNRSQRLYSDPDAFPAPLDSDHRNRMSSADLSVDRPLPSGHYTYGFSWRNDSLDSSNLGKRSADNLAVFANGEIQRGRVTLVPEIRNDRQSQFGSSLSPGLGLIFELRAPNSLTANVSRSFRAPSFDDLYWPEDNFAVGNPNLRPERAFAVDLTWRRSQHSLTLFRTSTRDLILWQPTPGGKWSPSNIGRAIMQGIELQTKGRTARLGYELNYTFLNAFDATDDPVTSGKQLIGRPKHQAKLVLTEAIGAWNLFLGLDAVSKRFSTSANTKAIGGYLLADLTIDREVPSLGTLQFSLRNPTDKRYETIPGYPMPGREVRLRISRSL